MSLIEVDFKGHRKGIYANPQEFPLKRFEWVVVRADRGEDLGRVSLLGAEWEEKFQQQLGDEEPELILRRANDADMERRRDNIDRERSARTYFLDAVKTHELEMKLVDAEYQLDGNKLTFYFTADGRVDFRSLVKDLAQHFKTRIDLRQIGARDESKRLGGMGICGREVCCESWIRTFEPVTTSMVKEQNLLLNPQKNTGLCGRLRCCLRYEVEQYRLVNQMLPKPDTKVKSPKRKGVVDKVDMCACACSVRWEDGKFSLFDAETLKALSDFDAEKSEPKAPITFKDDPDYKRDHPIAASAAEAKLEAEEEALKVKPQQGGGGGGRGGRKLNGPGKGGGPQKGGGKGQDRGRKPSSEQVVLVEAVPVSKPSDKPSGSEDKPKPRGGTGKRPRGKGGGGKPRRPRGGGSKGGGDKKDGPQADNKSRRQRAQKPKSSSSQGHKKGGRGHRDPRPDSGGKGKKDNPGDKQG